VALHPAIRAQDRNQQRYDDNAREYEDGFPVSALSLHLLSVTSGVTHSIRALFSGQAAGSR
jgi:hypothetical protein